MFVHAIEHGSYANGPGLRLVVWTQGCSIRCKGCWNPETHDFGGTSITTESILKMLVDGGFEGLTFTGGEPLEQADSVFALGLAAKTLGYSTVLFSGFSLGAIIKNFGGNQVAQSFDVLLSDPYVDQPAFTTVSQALSNKTITFFSDRYAMEDFTDIPACEVIIDTGGEIRITGLAAPTFKFK